MTTVFQRISHAFSTWQHHRRYPAVSPPTTRELQAWVSIYDAVHTTQHAWPTTRDEWLKEWARVYDNPTPPFIPLAIISHRAWQRLHEFCLEHDLEAGHTPWHRFDARQCINVWSIDLLHPRRWGELLFAFYADPLCGEDPMTVLDETLNGTRPTEELIELLSVPGFVGTRSAIVLQAQLLHSHRPHNPYTDEIAQVHHFLAKLYEHAVGHPLPLSVQQRSTWPRKESPVAE